MHDWVVDFDGANGELNNASFAIWMSRKWVELALPIGWYRKKKFATRWKQFSRLAEIWHFPSCVIHPTAQPILPRETIDTFKQLATKIYFKHFIFLEVSIMAFSNFACLQNNNCCSQVAASVNWFFMTTRSVLRAKRISFTSSSSWREQRGLKAYKHAHVHMRKSTLSDDIHKKE